ncbi:hypothetical protein LXL04_001730 [Taraxacum kok-saghyz]
MLNVSTEKLSRVAHKLHYSLYFMNTKCSIKFLNEQTSDNIPSSDGVTPSIPIPGADGTVPPESSIPCKRELELLAQGGVPMALRGELWQAFVGVKARHIDNYYQNLLRSNKEDKKMNNDSMNVTEKWKLQIEKDLPRTFPGHLALDEGGRNALRRLLTAYARHNPSVGYFQSIQLISQLILYFYYVEYNKIAKLHSSHELLC